MVKTCIKHNRQVSYIKTTNYLLIKSAVSEKKQLNENMTNFKNHKLSPFTSK